MQINKISIIIPCFNEKSTIIQTIEKVKEFKDFPIEIIIVDDHSNDGSVDLIKKVLMMIRSQKFFMTESMVKVGLYAQHLKNVLVT